MSDIDHDECRKMFAYYYVVDRDSEGAAGAYRRAFYEVDTRLSDLIDTAQPWVPYADKKARDLIEEDDVREHINRIRDQLIIEEEISPAEHMRQLAKLRDEAREAGDYSPAITAETNRGKVAGLYIERHVNMNADMSLEEIDAKLNELVERDPEVRKLIEQGTDEAMDMPALPDKVESEKDEQDEADSITEDGSGHGPDQGDD